MQATGVQIRTLKVQTTNSGLAAIGGQVQQRMACRMLNTDPETRYTMPKIRAHTWRDAETPRRRVINAVLTRSPRGKLICPSPNDNWVRLRIHFTFYQ